MSRYRWSLQEKQLSLQEKRLSLLEKRWEQMAQLFGSHPPGTQDPKNVFEEVLSQVKEMKNPTVEMTSPDRPT